MSNLPPGAANDPNAPWNRDYPEPDELCIHCGHGYFFQRTETRDVRVDQWLFIEHFICPQCGEVVKAVGRDELEPYLEFWREMPDEAKETTENPKEILEELANAVKRL